ncbi:MAG: TonB-dependent receptor [Opitutae bacterium]|nr:TonB-dependent receptor [Opitutae bacterium]
MNSPRPFAFRGAVFAASFLAATFAPAQTAVSSLDEKSKSEEPLQLSPFVVKADHDTGYTATDSLAGTRLRTPLKDIAASVSVVTKDLMDDLGAKGSADLLVYTTGTEVVGVGGNYSGSTQETAAQTFDPVRESTSPTTRVRGLAAADETRNYFLTPGIPFDSYNTQSVTLNRGANSILFGFGSPAGIIENTLIAPVFKDRTQVKVSAGSYGTYRQSLDFERVIIPGKLSLRLAQLDDNRRYEQDFTFRDQERYFASATYQPFRNTTLRVNAEHGHLDQRMPRVDPPVDSLTTWWDFGKPTRDNNFTSTATKNYQRANNLDGMAGNWSQNVGLVYYGSDQGNPSDALVPYATAPGITYRFLAPRSSQEIAASVTANPLAGFMVGKQLIDRSIFDYRKQLLDGPNSGTWMDFDTQNVALEQLFLDGDAGVELVYDHQQADSSVLRGISNSYRGNNIFIDVNTVTTDGRPNPNFGRPFIASNGFFYLYDNEYETSRATAFLRHDFTKHGKGFLWRLLGKQTVTGMFSDFKREQYTLSGYPQVVGPAFRDGLNGNTISTSRKITSVVYLGPSMANLASPTGANLQGVQTELLVPDTVNVMVENVGTGYAWTRQSVPTYTYLDDLPWLVTGNTALSNRAKSNALIWQGDWWSNHLVSILGWRRDEVESASGTNSTTDPTTGARTLDRPIFGEPLTTKRSTFSYGLALHVPTRWLEKIPSRPALSLYYNQSENFDVSAGARYNILGDYLAPQEGSTQEYGLGVRLFNDRLTLRATRYETTQDNMTDSRVSGVLVRVVDLEARITASLSKSFLDSIGYVGFDSPQASETFKRYLANYDFSVGAVRSDGTRNAEYSGPAATVETTSSVSKGYEFEAVFNATRNWRMALNVAKQEAVRGDTSPILTALVAERLEQWKNPALWPLTLAGGVQRVDSYATTYMINPLTTAKLSIGERTPELREWRANFVTNYTFDRDSRLKGWGIGGAVRWQDKVSIGYPVINDPALGLVTDVKHPFMGPDQTYFDGWVSYQRKLWHNKVGWKIQLNVRNLLNDNLMIPVKANPVTVGDLNTYDIAAWRIGEARTWEISSTFSF